LTKSISSSDNLNIQRRFAPIVIGCPEIADRFQMKTVIVFVKLRSVSTKNQDNPKERDV
jgi:hypothetical protein